jgi:hypothetical protein
VLADADNMNVLEWRSGPPLEHVIEGLPPVQLEVERQTGRKVIGVATSYFYHFEFMRLLAKIAHSYSVAELGMHGFKPILTNLIVCGATTPNPSTFIGGVGDLLDQHETVLHSIALGAEQRGGVWYLVARIRLFAIFGGAFYELVVGQLSESQKDSLDARKDVFNACAIEVLLHPRKPAPGARVLAWPPRRI